MLGDTRFTKTLSISLAVILLLLSPTARAQTTPRSFGRRRGSFGRRRWKLRAARHYIKQGWRTLARSNRRLAEAAIDPKFPPLASNRRPVRRAHGKFRGRRKASTGRVDSPVTSLPTKK